MAQIDRFTIAEQHQILDYDALAEVFFKEILDLDYQSCFVSDESMLSDFSGCGKHSLADSSSWDEWITNEVGDRYGVHLKDTNVYLVSLFHGILVADQAPKNSRPKPH